MAQDHFDRLTAVDASFLHQEGPVSHMHVGAVTIFEGPPPPFEEFLDGLRERLHLVPRYRQHLSVPPLETGRPLWVDDPSFNLEYHVRQTALPRRAPRSSCAAGRADLLPAARPLPSRCGSCGSSRTSSRGSGGRASRSSPRRTTR
jgi:hypothetical protein